MASNPLFYYFGDDEAYYRALLGEFGKSTRMSVNFKKAFSKDEKEIQSFFLKVFNERPACIFIDFSKHTQDYLHLARIISRVQMEHNLVTVGLVDYLSPPEVLSESIATGVTLTHIKSAETFDVAFDVAKLISPNDIGEHGFANAKMNDEYEIGIPAKIGYVHPEGLHIETDFFLQKGDRVKINHHWTTNRVVPSREVFIQNVTSKNLFYQFKYAADLEFLFVDEFLPPEGMSEEQVQERRTERNDLITYHKKHLSKWIQDNETRSLEKKAKVLVVDRKFHFYDNQPRTDKHAYTIRCIASFEDPGSELDRFAPQVIAYSMDPEGEPESKNTNEPLVRLMRTLKGKFDDRPPFVVVFNCKATSKELQDAFTYPQIMTYGGELSVEVMMKMAEVFDKKLSQILPVTKNQGPTVYLRKTNPHSLTEIVLPVKIVKLSECDMIFQCDRELQPGTNIHFTQPVDMYVHIMPSKSQGKIPEYYGLIHSLGEEQKMELRKFVNSVFFREHDAGKQAESEEFRKLNEQKLKEKLEILNKEIEKKTEEST